MGVAMLGQRLFRYPFLWLCLLFLAMRLCAQATEDSRGHEHRASLRVCLRLQDESTYLGSVIVRLVTREGSNIAGTKESDGIVVFPEVDPGPYAIEANAPGFAPVRQEIKVEAQRSLTQFLILNPRPFDFPTLDIHRTSSAISPDPVPVVWTPPGIDEVIPPVNPHVECPLEDVLGGAGDRVKQFVSDLEKFSASERVEHYMVDATGDRHAPDTRDFNYVVAVSRAKTGVFLLDEYRNGSVSPELFQARIATQGMPALVLVFHPQIMNDFNFRCEGLGRWQSKPAWQVRFTQRADRPGRILSYSVGGKYVSLPLMGRAWIDLETLQVVRLETELIRPLPEIALALEHIAITYEPVQFRTQGEHLWLPREVELYVERRGRRYYRRHTYKDFRLFTVETAQTYRFDKESYGFTNQSDRDVTGVLTVVPAPGAKLNPVSLTFIIPPGRTITKLVGPDKDITLPVDAVQSATFAHDGPSNSVKVEAHLSRGSTLDVVSETAVPKP
jgi:hypothetical protein